MEEVLRYVVPAFFTLIGTLVPAILIFKQNTKKAQNETHGLLVKQDSELREEIKLLWEENRKLREEVAELREKLYGN